MSYKLDTKEDWWKLVDDNWDNLRALIETFHPTKEAPKLKITARAAETIRQHVASEIKTLEDYEALKANRDVKLADVLNSTYWGVPESTSCWNYPGFGLLCDLCSENYVLEEEENNEH